MNNNMKKYFNAKTASKHLLKLAKKYDIERTTRRYNVKLKGEERSVMSNVNNINDMSFDLGSSLKSNLSSFLYMNARYNLFAKDMTQPPPAKPLI